MIQLHIHCLLSLTLFIHSIHYTFFIRYMYVCCAKNIYSENEKINHNTKQNINILTVSFWNLNGRWRLKERIKGFTCFCKNCLELKIKFERISAAIFAQLLSVFSPFEFKAHFSFNPHEFLTLKSSVPIDFANQIKEQMVIIFNVKSLEELCLEAT